MRYFLLIIINFMLQLLILLQVIQNTIINISTLCKYIYIY